MKKSQKRTVKGRPVAGRSRVFRAGVFACVLLAAGAVTAIARYESPGAGPHFISGMTFRAPPTMHVLWD